MSYTHLLISTDPAYVPPFEALKNFFVVIEALGVVPEPWEIWVLDRDGHSLLQTPRGSTIRVPGRKVPVDDLFAAEPLVGPLANYDLRASGDGVPRRTLMPVAGWPQDLNDLTETVQVAVAWHVRPGAVAMSDVHGDGPDVPGHFVPCDADDRPGHFTIPGSMTQCEVPHAGAARFWISVHLGNGARPEFPTPTFDTVPAAVMRELEGVVGVRLAQGGAWE